MTRVLRPSRARTRPGRLAGLAGGVVSCVLLAGCAGLHPGAAVVVGDDVVTDDRLDAAASALCTYFEPQLEQQQQAVPLVEVRRSAAVLLALRAAVEQLAADYEASPTTDYNRELDRLEGLAETLPEDEREAFLEVQSAQAYVPTTLSEVGTAVLEAEGDADAAEADLTTRTAAGLRVLADFLRSEEVEFAPGLGMRVEVGEVPEAPTLEEVNAVIGSFFVPVDPSSSVAVSDLAVAASSDDTQGTAATALPADQRCG